MNDGFRVEGSIRIPLKKKREKRFQDKRFSPKKLSCDGDHSRRHMKGSSLELELQTQAQAGRELEDRARAIERIRNRSHTRDTAIDLERFVQTNRALVVEDIEPVNLEAQLPILTEDDRIVGVQVEVVGGRRASVTDAVNRVREASDGGRHRRNDGRTANYAKTFVVAVDRVRNQLVERDTALRAE